MKISIVIPTFNCADLLGHTLKSIEMGGWDDTEVIVMDGASTDHIAEVAEQFKDTITTFVSEPDEGQYDAINKGMALASGEVLCWLNGGDFFIPGAIQTMAVVYETYPDIEWTIGRQCVADGEALRKWGNFEVVVSNPEIRYGLCCGGAVGCLQQEGMFWRRSLWEKAGPLDTEYSLAADFELWIRFARATNLVRLTIPTGVFSYHETNRSIQLRDKYFEEVETVISKFTDEQKTKRKRLSPIAMSMRIIREIPVVKNIVRLLVRKVVRMNIDVISWRRSQKKGFVMKRQRRVSWIR